MTRAENIRVVAALAAILAGCGTDANNSAIERVDPASAADCPYGGKIVSSGFDRNGDGLLEDSEVTTRTPVCDPGPPASSLIVIRVVAEPPGANCSAGGEAVQSGPDLNGNGQLDDAEVTHTDYLCQQALLTRITSEPAGLNCSDGGVAFAIGTDRDGDGVLEDAEVESTDYVCGDVAARDVVIHNDAEAAALASIRVITGGLTVQLTAIHSLSLPQLERIGGSLQVLDNQKLNTLALPALQAVDGAVVLHSDSLTTITCPQLARVGSLDLELLSLASLTSFSALTEIDGAVEITDMPALTTLGLPQASSTGDVSITGNAKLAHLAWDVTDHLGAIDIHGNPKLQTIDLSMNTFFGGPTQVGGVSIASNPLLTHLALRAQAADSFTIGADPLLADLQVLVTTFAHDVTLVGITAPVRLALVGHFGAMTIGGNLTIAIPAESLDSGDEIDVQGRFVLDSTQLQTLARFANSLRVVQGLQISNNAWLPDLSAFALVGDLVVTNNPLLSTVNLELELNDEVGAVTITDNPMLTSAPALVPINRTHGAIDIERNPLLTGVFGPDLSRIEGSALVHDNASLTALAFPALVLVGSSLEVSSNAALQTLALPVVPEVSGALTIGSNPQLRAIDFTALTQTNSFRVDSNPQLPTCQVLAIFGHTSGTEEQSGNNDAATCGP